MLVTRHAILSTVVAAVTAFTPVADAEPSEPERLYFEGQKAYDAQRYDGALASWLRSYELSKLPGLQFNIAQAYRLRGLPGDCTKAMDSYKRFIELDPRSPQRQAAEGFIVELKPCASTVVPAAPVGGGPAPAHRASGDGSTKRLAAYVVAGGSVAVVLTGAYFGRKASSLGDEVTAACKDGCDWSVVRKKDADGRSAERKQWVCYGVGVAGGVASGVLYWLGTRDERAAAVAIVPRGDGGVVTWRGSW